jgi:hypothetical protein
MTTAAEINPESSPADWEPQINENPQYGKQLSGA